MNALAAAALAAGELIREFSDGDRKSLLALEAMRAEKCTRFDARHAWHFDTSAHVDPDASFRRLPSGSASGSCEPWKL